MARNGFNADEWNENAKEAEELLRDAFQSMNKAQREGALAVIQFHKDWYTGEKPCGHKRLGRLYVALAKDLQPA